MREAIRLGSVLTVIALTSAAAFAVDPPDLRINTVSGLIETVDATWSGSDYNVRCTQVTSAGQQTASSLISSNAANDSDPRIAIDEHGDVLVAWWRDQATDALVYRKRSLSTGAWSIEFTAGLPGESNSHPRVVFADDQPWVAYEIQHSKTRSIGVQIIDDDPEPFRSIVATTGFAGALDMELNAEERHLWVTWIDGESNLGYAEYSYDKQRWSIPDHEPFAGEPVSAARERVRERVLGS